MTIWVTKVTFPHTPRHIFRLTHHFYSNFNRFTVNQINIINPN
jgi:hypothetical protein